MDGIIVFTDSNAKLRVSNPTVPVLPINDLVDYIERQQPKIKFSSNELESIANIINIQA